MKQITLILSIVIYALTSFAQKPQTDAVYESIIEEYTLNEDGSLDYHFYKKMKYLTPTSFNRYFGETFIVYDPSFQALTINKSQTIQEDGNIIITPENAFNEVLPRFAKNAPSYNHYKEMVITHTGLEVNCIVELDYTLHSQSGYLPAFSDEIVLMEAVPVQEHIVRIITPKDKNLNYKVSNIRTSPTIIDRENEMIYEFVFRGLKAMHSEKMKPIASSFAPVLDFSFEDFNTVYQDIVSGDAFMFTSNKEMEARIADIKKNSKNDLEVVLAIQEIVVNEINTFHIPIEFSATSSRVSNNIWNSNGGSPFEKSILLTTLYRAAGINAYPVFVLPGSLNDSDPFSFKTVEDVLVQVNPRETKQLYLSPVSNDRQNRIFALENKKGLVLDPKKEAGFISFKHSENTLSFSADFELTDSLTIEGEINLDLYGKMNPALSLMREDAYAKSLLSGGLVRDDINDFTLKSNSISRSEINFEILQSDKPEDLKGYYFIDLPVVNAGFHSWHLNYLNSERVHPLEIPYVLEEVYDIQIELPSKLKLINPVEGLSLKTDVGSVRIEFVQDGNDLRIIRELKLNTQDISLKQYQSFKKLIDTWNTKKYNELVFKFEK